MSASAIDNNRRLAHYRNIVSGRLVEERLALLYGQGRVSGGVYLGTGQESLSAAAGMCLRDGDHMAPLIRDQAGRLAFGESIEDTLRCHLGKRTGPMKGRDGNVHRGSPSQGILPMVSHLGAMFGVVAGLLYADRKQGRSDTIGLLSIGEGGINTGASSEGLNLIAVEKLPVVLIVANNGFAYSTTNEYSFAVKDLQDRGRGFGWSTHHCDGRDAQDCLRTCSSAANAARNGHGPQMIVADLMRLRGHGEHDDGCYMGEDRKRPEQDCLQRCEEELLADGVCTADDFTAVRSEISARIEAALKTVDGEPDASPATENWQIFSDLDKLYVMEAP